MCAAVVFLAINANQIGEVGRCPLDCVRFSLDRIARDRQIAPRSRIRGSSNGRTADSGSAYRGSNPCPRTSARSRTGNRPHSLAVRTSASHAEISGSSPDGVTKQKRSEISRFRAFFHARSPDHPVWTPQSGLTARLWSRLGSRSHLPGLQRRPREPRRLPSDGCLTSPQSVR